MMTSSMKTSSSDVEALQAQKEALRKAIEPRGETLIQSVRSRLVHKIKVSEDSNPLRKWRTVCARNFTRIPAREADERPSVARDAGLCRDDLDYFSKAMQATPTLICAGDFGLLGRPRLWWTRSDIGAIKR